MKKLDKAIARWVTPVAVTVAVSVTAVTFTVYGI